MPVIKILREALMTTMIVSAPMLGVGMIVGLVVSIFQTTTSIQEQTLTFVPEDNRDIHRDRDFRVHG